MTVADRDALIEYCTEVGRPIDHFLALLVLHAKELYAADPTNKNALDVVNEFAEFLKTGDEDAFGFSQFMLGPLPELEGETEERAAYNEMFLAHCAKIPPREILQKVAPYFRKHESERLGWTEGWFRFAQRTGLTVEQIATASPEELARYA